MAGPIALILGGLLWRGDIPWWPSLIGVPHSILVALAILGQIEPASRAYIAGALRKANFTQVGTYTTRRRLDWLWNRLCDLEDDIAGVPATFRAALTWRLYDRALLFAVAYPIIFFVNWGAVAGEGRIGPTLIFAPAPFLYGGLTVLPLMVVFLVS